MKRVAIAGYGVEGQSNYRYFAQRGCDVTIVDENPDATTPDDAQAILGPGVFDQLHDFDMVVRTAGLAPRAIATDGQIWSATNEFFAQCPAPIIGVTGTKGKGTTVSLIASILRASGQKVHVVGNIGVPALDVLDAISPDDTVVYELSSFQLWDLQRSPALAVVLMIEPDHLDVHTDMADYIAAKSSIAAHQSVDDTVIVHPTNPYSQQIAAAGKGRVVRYAVADDGQAYVRDGMFCVGDTQLCSVEALAIPGAHNIENACAAISAALAAGAATDAVQSGLAGFTGLPHRLKFVREVGNVKYYDDSIATTPGSAIAALRAFDAPTVIILGGHDKGAAYDDIVAECKQRHAQVIAIGKTGEAIAALCRDVGVVCQRETGGMKRVVQAARSAAQPGGVVILSPASASFDQYKSYSDRGEQFVAAVGEL